MRKFIEKKDHILKIKTLLFLGIALLLTGIVLKNTGTQGLLPLLLIVGGGLCKISYVIASIITGKYKPGREIFLLYVGLAIFLTGIYLRSHEFEYYPLFMATGISMKLVFIILFIRKVKKLAKRTIVSQG